MKKKKHSKSDTDEYLPQENYAIMDESFNSGSYSPQHTTIPIAPIINDNNFNTHVGFCLSTEIIHTLIFLSLRHIWWIQRDILYLPQQANFLLFHPISHLTTLRMALILISKGNKPTY